jgi:hypothetical protein
LPGAAGLGIRGDVFFRREGIVSHLAF